MPTIKLCDCCTSSSLSTGTVTLSGSDSLLISYFIGTGVQSYELKAAATCEGFIQGIIKIVPAFKNLDSESEF